jgi:hypothetical protein
MYVHQLRDELGMSTHDELAVPREWAAFEAQVRARLTGPDAVCKVLTGALGTEFLSRYVGRKSPFYQRFAEYDADAVLAVIARVLRAHAAHS